MNYIFDIDDTLLLSEKIKKKTYFDYILVLREQRKISPIIAEKAFQKLNIILFQIGEKDIFDTALKISEIINPMFNQTQLKKESLKYVKNQLALLQLNYRQEAKEIPGAYKFLQYLNRNGSFIGINTGNPISFAKNIVIDRKWPIKLKFVYGAGDKPDIHPYSLDLKRDNIISFAQEILKSATQSYKKIDEVLQDITMVGDDILDYKAAQNSGVKFIGIRHNIPSKLDDIPHIQIVNNFDELMVLKN